jgi:hypothetical protein
MDSKVFADGTFVSSYLKTRLDALRAAQNTDGGWGYFPGKESWLEPTAYAAMALAGEPEGERAWKLLASWQLADGSWKTSVKVAEPSWGTSLCVTIAIGRNEWSDAAHKGVNWLLGSAGAESGWFSVVATKIGLMKGRNVALKSWPWKPGNSGWVEPTAHALVALKKASAKWPSGELSERVRMGEAELADVRSRDGGWNYGSPAALGSDLPSYPETTALALVGLQEKKDLSGAFELASKMMLDTPSPLAWAWLKIAMRLHGMNPADADTAAGKNGELGKAPGDVMITAVEALSAAEGEWSLMRTGEFSQTGARG